MKNTIKISAATFILSLIFWGTSFAQDLQNFRTNDKTGLSIFETPKDNNTTFEGVKVTIGGVKKRSPFGYFGKDHFVLTTAYSSSRFATNNFIHVCAGNMIGL